MAAKDLHEILVAIARIPGEFYRDTVLLFETLDNLEEVTARFKSEISNTRENEMFLIQKKTGDRYKTIDRVSDIEAARQILEDNDTSSLSIKYGPLEVGRENLRLIELAEEKKND